MPGSGLLTLGQTNSRCTTTPTVLPITGSEQLTGFTVNTSNNTFSPATTEVYFVPIDLFMKAIGDNKSIVVDIFDTTAGAVVQSFNTSVNGSSEQNFMTLTFSLSAVAGRSYSIRVTVIGGGEVFVSLGRVLLDNLVSSSGGGSVSFANITSGTNVTAMMTIGSGCVMNVAPGGVLGSSSLTATSTIAGSGAGNALNAGNINCTLIGSGAGTAMFGSGDTDNTFIGFNAGSAANGSVFGGNTLIGSGTAIGAANAVRTVAVGFNAVAPTGGTVIGNAAGKAAATAARFTCIGNTAGAAITGGADNTFVGDQAGAAIVGTSQNTFIGSSAARLSSAGSNNTVVGYNSAVLMTGGNNVSVGSSCASTLTSGVGNTLIGYQADVNAGATSNAIFIGTGAGSVQGSSSSVIIKANAAINSSTTNDLIIESGDVGLRRVVAKVMQPTDGAGVGAWLQNSAGRSRVNADIPVTGTAFSNMTGTTLNLIAGRKYSGFLTIKCNNTTATEGIKFDFNGGGATMTSFWAVSTESAGGTTVLGTAISTSLAGVINYTTITGETLIVIYISLVVNAAGTFIPRFAENSTAVGTATVELGTYLFMEDMP